MPPFVKPATLFINPPRTVTLLPKRFGRKIVREKFLSDLLELCFQCHRLAPFCNYNGNTFVTIVKTLMADELKRLPPDEAHVLRSIAGHIVAGTATNIEVKQLGKMLSLLEQRAK